MDGVLADWYSAAVAACKHLTTQEVLDSIEVASVVDPFAISHVLGHDVDKMVEQQGVDFWTRLEPLPLHRELVELVKSVSGVEVGFLSNPHTYTYSGIGKRLWLAKHGYDPDLLVLTKSRQLCASTDPQSYLIDDLAANVASFRAAGGRAFCWPSQHTLKSTWSYSGQAVLNHVKHWLQSC